MTAQPPTMETVCEQCGGVGELDTGGFTPDGTGILVACPTCTGTGNTQPPVGTEKPKTQQGWIDFYREHTANLEAALATLRTRLADAERKGWNAAIEAAEEAAMGSWDEDDAFTVERVAKEIRALHKGESR